MEDGVKRNEDLTVASLISNTGASQPESKPDAVPATEEAPVESHDNKTLKGLITSTTSEQTPDTSANEPQEELSPLDAAIQAKNSGETGGFVTEAANPDDEAALRNPLDTDERREDLVKKMDEIDMLSLKAKAVIGIKKPKSPGEYALMMDDINNIEINPDTGEILKVPASEWFIARTPEVEEEIKKIGIDKPAQDPETDDGNENTQKEYHDIDVDTVMKESEKDRVVHILIDKTGLGQDISFNEEEKEKLATSNLIHLVEVEDRDLQMVSFEKPEAEDSFLTAISKYQLSVSKVPMTFPASGFKAEMTGLSFGEYSDIALNPGDNSTDYVDYDKMRRRMYVVYKHMVNSSIGDFKTFEEFLDKFAYVDLALAVYGLVIATQPEMDELTFTCKEGCGKTFTYKYSPRSIIDFESADMGYLQKIEEINTAAPQDRQRLAEQSAVRRVNRIKLSQSGWIVDIGMISCGDYLTKMISYVNDIYEKVDSMDENDPQLDEIGKKLNLLPILHSIRLIAIPSANGKYLALDTVEKIIDGILSMPPADFNVLTAACSKYIGNYHIGFAMKNVECTHCHKTIESMTITPDELVFLIAQQLGNTEISFDNFLY